MSQFVNYLKSLASNKNFLKSLILIVLVIVVWVIYNNLVTAGRNPGSVYVAKEALYPGDIITTDLVKTTSVAKKYLKNISAIKSGGGDFEKIKSGEWCIKQGYSIPAGGLIYTDALTSDGCGDLYSNSEFPGGYVIYQLSVNNTTTYGNSILPGSYIDLYIKINKGAIGNPEMIYLKFIEHMKVFRVADGARGKKSKDVFAQDPYGSPAFLWFLVKENDFNVLDRITNLKGKGITLIPVPRGAKYSEKFSKEGDNIKTEPNYTKVMRMIDSISINVTADGTILEENN